MYILIPASSVDARGCQEEPRLKPSTQVRLSESWSAGSARQLPDFFAADVADELPIPTGAGFFEVQTRDLFRAMF